MVENGHLFRAGPLPSKRHTFGTPDAAVSGKSETLRPEGPQLLVALMRFNH